MTLGSAFWTPSREWEGQDAHLIGGGPSLKGCRFDALIGKNVIGCNDACHLGAQVVSYVIFGDASWWQRNRFVLEQYRGKIVTNASSMANLRLPNIFKMKRIPEGLGSGDTLGWNYSTGAAAINLAISLGATRIFLLGYDLGNQDQVSHWHNHNGKTIQEFAFQRFVRGFDRLKACLPSEVTVLNVTDGSSRLKSFPVLHPNDYWDGVLGVKEVAA